MPKATFRVNPVVCIEIDDPARQGLNPSTKKKGIVGKLDDFLMRNNILKSERISESGPGHFIGFFTPHDANIIQTWLNEQNDVEEIK